MEVLTSLRLRIILSFLLAALVLGTGGVILHRSSRRTQDVRAEAGRTRSEIIALQGLLATMEDAETGQRGYLLTGDQSYLAPYRQATALIESELYGLEGFQKGDRLLQANFLPLQRHIHAKLSELRQTIGLCQNADTSSARKIVLEGTGQREMGSIRSLILTLLTEQNHKLDQLQRDYQTSTSRSNRLLAGGIGIQFLLLVLVFVFFYRDATNRFRSAREMQRAHARLDAILSTMSDGVYQVDRRDKLLYLNPAGEQLLGYSLREIEGVGMHNLIHAHSPGGEYRPADQCPLSEVMRSGVSYFLPPDRDDWFRRKDGSFITVEYAGVPVRAGEEIIGVVISFRDVTERRRHEEQLRVMTELQQAILSSANVAILSCRADGVITTFNPAAERMLQYRADEVIGKMTPSTIHDPEEIRRRAEELSNEMGIPVAQGVEAFTTQSGTFGLADRAEWTYIRKDGSRFPVDLSTTALRDAEGKVNGYIGIAEDITERKASEAAIRESQILLQQALEREKDEARLDFLTQIANRRAFYEAAATEVIRARRYHRPLTLVYIDLDNFKVVNDTFGHKTGDRLLVEVAATLRINIRGSDTVARLGGDEFVILLAETDQDAGMLVTEKLRGLLLNAMQRENWPVTFSIGLISFLNSPESVEEMMSLADAMMYSVKQKGKNSIAARVLA